MRRTREGGLAVLLAAAVGLVPVAANSAAPPEDSPKEEIAPASPSPSPPAPVYVPDPEPKSEPKSDPEEDGSLEDFAIAPPESARLPDPSPQIFAASPGADPGMAPDNGVSMLVLGGTGLALTGVGAGLGLGLGIARGVSLEWLLPSVIVSSVGLLAFSGGALYLGVDRARSHRRWLVARGLMGTPQGGGLTVGGTFLLLAAAGLIPGGAVALYDGDRVEGISMLAAGVLSAAATPVMFVFSVRQRRRYAATGGWKRRILPPVPGASLGALELRPRLHFVPGGAGLGLSGRF